MIGKTDQRDASIDLLRVIACAMVVLSHCCDGFVAQFDADRESFLWGVGVGSLMRPCVPLFAMMTGVLLLPVRRETSLTQFYHKRVGRLIVPLIFWSLVLPMLAYAWFAGMGKSSINPSVDLAAYTPSGLGYRLWSWLLNFNFDTTPLWYLYMLLGLYLIMPVISAWLREASRSEVRMLLYVWAATLFVPYLELLAPFMGYTGNYGNMGLFGACDWNVFTTFYYVSGFAGYLLLAYYLKRWPIEGHNMVLSAMFLVGFVITFAGYIAIQRFYPGDFAYLEIVWYFCGVNVMLMTVPVFVWTMRCKPAYPRIWANLAGLTFGIYLCHFVFVLIGYDLLSGLGLPPIARILLNAAGVFVVSSIVTRLLISIPFTSRLVS